MSLKCSSSSSLATADDANYHDLVFHQLRVGFTAPTSNYPVENNRSLQAFAINEGERQEIQGWWGDDTSTSTLSPATEAFENARNIFNAQLTKDQKKQLDLSRTKTIQDVLSLVTETKEKWENKPRWDKARKWLGAFSARVEHYGSILDVLVQHHPEYTSLAWGAMKFLFVVVINHETTVKEIAKTLTKITYSLPQIRLYSILYPTNEMKYAVAALYASILSFFQQAAIWYKDGKFSHVVKAVWKPFDLAFKDYVDEICEKGRIVNELASAGHKADTRRGIWEQKQARLEQQQLYLMVQQLLVCREQDRLEVSRTLFGEIKHHLVAYDFDANSALTVNTSVRRRFDTSKGPYIPAAVLSSPSLQAWATTESSSFLWVNGRSRSAIVSAFAVDVIDAVKAAGVPVAWLFCSNYRSNGNFKGPVDLVKCLIFQILQHRPDVLLRNGDLFPKARFKCAKTLKDAWGIMTDLLQFIPKLFIVVDSVDSYDRPASSRDTCDSSNSDSDDEKKDASDISQLIGVLLLLVAKSPTRVKIVLTTRVSTILIVDTLLGRDDVSRLDLGGGQKRRVPQQGQRARGGFGRRGRGTRLALNWAPGWANPEIRTDT